MMYNDKHTDYRFEPVEVEVGSASAGRGADEEGRCGGVCVVEERMGGRGRHRFVSRSGIDCDSLTRRLRGARITAILGPHNEGAFLRHNPTAIPHASAIAGSRGRVVRGAGRKVLNSATSMWRRARAGQTARPSRAVPFCTSSARCSRRARLPRRLRSRCATCGGSWRVGRPCGRDHSFWRRVRGEIVSPSFSRARLGQ